MDESDGWTHSEGELWLSSNPPWGTVRDVVIEDEYALVFDALNSDEREIELTVHRRRGDRWLDIIRQDDAGFPEVGDTHGGGWSFDPHGECGYGWTFGRELPGTVVELTFKGAHRQSIANAGGWWMCIIQTDVEEQDRPTRIS